MVMNLPGLGLQVTMITTVILEETFGWVHVNPIWLLIPDMHARPANKIVVAIGPQAHIRLRLCWVQRQLLYHQKEVDYTW